MRHGGRTLHWLLGLALTDDQKKKNRIDVRTVSADARVSIKADLEREESVLNRMLEAETLEPSKSILAQTDKVIQARAEMEKTNSKMTLDMRLNLTALSVGPVASRNGPASLVDREPSPR
jgi:hypothetical protein